MPALILPLGATCPTHCTYCPWFCHPNYKIIVANSKTFIYKAHDWFNHVLQLAQCLVCSYKSRRAPFSFITSVRPSVCRCHRGCHCVDFREIWYWSLLRKSVKKLKIPLKSGKRNYRTPYMKTYVRFCSWQTYEIFCSSTPVQRELIVAFLWQHWTLILLIDMLVSNNTKRTVVAFPWQRWALILLRDICVSSSTKRTVVSFPWQRWALILYVCIYIYIYVSNNTKRTVVTFPWQRWAFILLIYIYICQQQYKVKRCVSMATLSTCIVKRYI